MSSRRGAPPLPPPRDPAGINSIVQRHSSCSLRDPDEDMSSDSSSPPRPPHKRRSSYENVEQDQGFYPNKPPPPSNVRRSRESLQRSTPSPRPLQHVRSSPRQDSWSDALSDDAGAEPTVRRRPPSSCGRAPRSHRGSMPPVECLGSGWGHRSPCAPCCGPSPVPYHWCGPPQGWSHYNMHQIVRVQYFVRGGFVGHRSRISSKHLSHIFRSTGFDFSGVKKGLRCSCKMHVWVSDPTKTPTAVGVLRE
ncbi:uncharacterized protein TNCV_5117821 [Trichonephila clavipes]|nr:uncharacterized protein TNCV_5117821 [Trichonephila clavipes]